MTLIVRNRYTNRLEKEQIYGEGALQFLYGKGWISRIFGRPCIDLVSKSDFFSILYGQIQKTPFSKSKIKPFIKKFNIDPSEFLKSVDAFSSFNDFFIRELKPGARPITPGNDIAIIPTDGRFLGFQDVSTCDGFFVKGKKFDLKELLQNDELADLYAAGTMVIGRLCPIDYHRFHFPVDCVPTASNLINGYYFSVNPIALKRNIEIFSENKRCYSILNSESFGKVLFMEVGATSVGTIIQIYTPDQAYKKGDEKGYFSFGGSALIILFEPRKIQLDADLAATADDKIELRCLLGQSLGKISDKK